MLKSDPQIEAAVLPCLTVNSGGLCSTSGTSPPEVKKCTKCDKEQELILFDKNKSKRDGRESHCKHCVSKRKRKKNKSKKMKKRKVNIFTVFTSQSPDDRLFVLKLKQIIEEIKS